MSAITAFLLAWALGSLAIQEQAGPPGQEATLATDDSLVIARGRFEAIKFAPLDPARKVPGKSGELDAYPPPPAVGVFAPTEWIRSGTGAQKVLVDLTIQDPSSAACLWMCSECTLVLEPTAVTTTSATRELRKLAEEARQGQEALAGIYAVARRGKFGLAIAPASMQVDASGNRIALVNTDWFSAWSGWSGIESERYGDSSWSSSVERTLVEKLANSTPSALLEGAPSRQRHKLTPWMVVIHPTTRRPSMICFVDKPCGTGVAPPPKDQVFGAKLVYWPDGRMIRVSKKHEDGTAEYEECRFQLSAMLQMVEWMETARGPSRSNLVGAELAPDGSTRMAEILGFGEPVSLAVDSIHTGPRTQAYNSLLASLSGMPVSNPMPLGAIELEQCCINVPTLIAPPKKK